MKNQNVISNGELPKKTNRSISCRNNRQFPRENISINHSFRSTVSQVRAVTQFQVTHYLLFWLLLLSCLPSVPFAHIPMSDQPFTNPKLLVYSLPAQEPLTYTFVQEHHRQHSRLQNARHHGYIHQSRHRHPQQPQQPRQLPGQQIF